MNGELKKLLEALESARQEAMARLRELAEADLDRRSPERGWSIRQILQRMADHEREHTVHLLRARRKVKSPRSEVNRALAELQAVRADLMESLVGLPDEALGVDWEPGEWTIGRILEHLRETEGWWLGEIENIRRERASPT